MLFNSFEFGIFLGLVLLLYRALPMRGQNRLLLVASYVFYGAWDWRFLALILASTIVDYVVGLRLAAERRDAGRRAWLGVSVVANLTLLGAFKYAGFFSQSLADLASLFGATLPVFFLDVVLPVGISFYTFQTLSYTLDIYRRQLEPTRHFLDFALFVAFFPQLVAGPIERARNLLPQIQAPRRPTAEQWSSGCWLILLGLYKKVVVADNLAFLVDRVYRPGADPTSLELLIGTYAFFFQLYCDFSGYTDVARGVARLLGFELMLNFRRPIFARNITEFWNRWHISLGSWVRDYVYIPLGGNRRGDVTTARNLVVMFLLIGLWHGAAWSFVLWGAFNGLMMVIHRFAAPWLAARPARGGWLRASRVGSSLLLFHLNCFALLLFRSTSVEQVFGLSGTLGSGLEVGLAASWLPTLLLLVAPLLLLEVWQERSDDEAVVLSRPVWQQSVLYFFLFLSIVLLGEDHEIPYVYFQF